MKKIIVVSILALLLPVIAFANSHEIDTPTGVDYRTGQQGISEVERIYGVPSTSQAKLLSVAFMKTLEWHGLPLAASLVVSSLAVIFAVITFFMRKVGTAFSFGLAGLLGFALAAWAKIDPTIRLFDMIDTILVPVSLISSVIVGIFAVIVGYGFYFVVKKWRTSSDVKSVVALVAPILLSIFLLGASYAMIAFVPDPGVREHPEGIAVTNRAVAEVVADNLNFPAFLAIASDGRIFFSEFRTGLIGVLEPTGDGNFNKVDYAKMTIPEESRLEQGLWGITMDPNGEYLYAMGTDKIYNQDGDGFSHLVRFKDENGTAGEMEEIITGIPAGNFHNGGAMTFGPDGKLYFTVGDVAQKDTVRDPRFINGKILRVNPDGSVPEDNVYLDSPVYASGLRHVYGIGFHPETDDFYATVNGPNCCDRIIKVHKGGDYGWPTYGNHPDDAVIMKRDPTVIAPLKDYGFARTAPTQMVFLNTRIYGDEFYNNLIYGTWATAAVHRAVLSEDGNEIIDEEIILVVEKEPREEYIPTIPGGVNGVAVGADGYLYVATASKILRITEIQPLE